MQLIECVPNISEGIRKDVIDSVVAELKTSDVKLLDVESDSAHNRSVITFIGTPQNIKKALFALCEKAIELIDLNQHKGEHPRMGAVDVIPFVPISSITTEECVAFAKEFAKEFAEKFQIPVYLYEDAAITESRRNLAAVRKGEFEGLRELIGKDNSKIPDFGPNRIHPTAGATAIGVRMPLIAFNVNLGTNNIDIAKKIAKGIRYSSGGLRFVKALAFEIKERNIVQISMNLVNYEGTPIYRVLELIKCEAERYGIPIIGSEIVGLVPLKALTDCIEYYLKLEKFTTEQILEFRLGGIAME